MQPRNDFDFGDLVRQSNEHEQLLQALANQSNKHSTSIELLLSRVGDSKALSESLKEAFDNDKNFDKVMSDIVKDKIKNDADIKKQMAAEIASIDRNSLNNTIKIVASAVAGAVITIICGIIINKLSK